MTQSFLAFKFAVILLLSIPVFSVYAENFSSRFLNNRYSQQHNSKNDTLYWSNQATKFAQSEEFGKQITALQKLAEIYRKQGQLAASISTLKNAKILAEKANDPRQKISLMNHLGAAYTATGQYSEASTLLQQSEEKARKLHATHLLATILNNQGNLKIQQEKFDLAFKYYDKSIKLALSIGYFEIAKNAAINSAIAASKTADSALIENTLLAAKKQLDSTKTNDKKAFDWITLGEIAQKLSTDQINPSKWQEYAYHAYKQAIVLAENTNNMRATSYAKAYMGKLYADDGRLDEALQLTQQAIFALENITAADILFRWQWQIARILKQKAETTSAIQAYQQAISTLQPIRQNLSSRQQSNSTFKKQISPLYLELTDLLLLTSEKLTDSEKIQQYLMLARHTMEQLKAAELQDYFKDDCVSALEQKIRPLDNMGSQTAAIYPILLTDRLEILLSLPDGHLKRFSHPVSHLELTKEVRQFRHNLENRTTREYLLQAQQLYQWIIAPIHNTLTEQNIKTLVIVPDESLRTIPMAALHDGDSFLIEKYAIANTPGLNLTDPKPLNKNSTTILSSGLTQSVQGFPPLPYVATELQSIQKIFGGKVLQDKAFLINTMESQLQKNTFDIVHIASHSQFTSDANENYILTFDDKLSMNKLEQLIALSKYRNNPIELLTLSACQTAAGDDRAALGLAGIAVKAGARSAVATLWFINDKAASELISEFYHQLKQNSVSKAQALKNAQTHMIQNTAYRHPYYWSAFLLIGNWL